MSKESKSRFNRRKTKVSVGEEKPVPIVGIGASAGGLEAVTQFLRSLPSDTGAGVVVIQHLDPSHKSLTAEILGRATTMSVVEAKNGLRVRPNFVYVIPSNYYLALEGGKLKLSPRRLIRGLYLPIDFFFESLAGELRDRAIGVVLSGTASDGAKGLVAIKDEGGITFAQEPASAKFASMPQSAIATGEVDFVLNPKDTADEISRILRDKSAQSKTDLKSSERKVETQNQTTPQSDLNELLRILREKHHIDFNHYKRASLLRRINRRLLIVKCKDLADYVEYLESHPGESDSLVADILIHVTKFFRDPDSFEFLKKKVLPKLLENRKPGLPIRVWVAGCSTGEEAYSLAIVFLEVLEDLKSQIPVQIFASDISDSAIQKARLGTYSGLAKDVSKFRLEKFFDKVPGGYRIKKRIRDLCVFSKHDLTRDPPFAKLDVISCRNVLIYFDDELQKSIFPIFNYSLNPGGFLFLGKAENINGAAGLFSVVSKANKCFQKKDLKNRAETSNQSQKVSLNLRFPTFDRSIMHSSSSADVQTELDRIALKEYAPPSVVINASMDILQVRGRTSPFLELSSGQPSLNLSKMARPKLLKEIGKLVQSANKKNLPVKKEGLHILDVTGPITFDIKVAPLRRSLGSEEQCYAIFFEVVPTSGDLNRGLQKTRSLKKTVTKAPALKVGSRKSRENYLLELEKIRSSQEQLQALNEDFETSQEELAAANEELQSANEELQSSNEELETSREEIQATNEELSTINDELQIRNAEIVGLNADLVNFFASTEIPLVMIDADERIRRFTPKAEKIFKILSTDIGRKIGDLRPDIKGHNLEDFAKEVIRTSLAKEIDVQDSAGHWYQLSVKPFSNAERKIDGAVIALVDIHSIRTALESAKVSERSLAIASADAIKLIEESPIPTAVFDPNLSVVFANLAFCTQFNLKPSEVKSQSLSALGDGQWNIPELARILQRAVVEGVEFRNFELSHTFQNFGFKFFLLNARRIRLPGSGLDTVMVTFEDITNQRKVENERANALSLLQHVSKKVPGLIYQYITRPDGSSFFPFASEGMQQIYRLDVEDVNRDASKLLSVIYPDDREILSASLSKSAKDLSPWTLEYRVKFDDGVIRWLFGSASAERLDDGSILWNGYVHDITDRKCLEEKQKQSEEKFRNLANNFSYGIMVINKSGIIDFANTKIEEIFGFAKGELLGQHYEQLITVADRKKHSVFHEMYMANPQPRKMGKGLDLVGRRKDESIFPIDVRLSPFKMGSEVFVNCVISDITDEKQIEETRKRLAVQERALRDEAIKSNRDKDEFLATLSHELRTPLTTILGWTQQLMLKDMDNEIKDALSVIERSAKAQTQLVEDLLDVSRINAGKISLNLQVIDLGEVLRSAISSVSVLAGKKKIQLETSFSSTRCNVLADNVRLQQIFWNILTNAIKFTPHGGKVKVSLAVIDGPKKSIAQVQITDTGMGIKTEFLPHIFERFRQLDSSLTRVYGGLGLGLAIVKSLVDQHMGAIEAKSEGEGMGATFIVTLPLEKRKNLDKLSNVKPDTLPVRLDGLKILVVDDNADNLYLFDIMLKSMGVEVQTADSAQSCLQILPNFRPDLLISDISMPGEDGYSLIRKIRSLDTSQGGKIPAIALTAYAAPEEVRIALDAGFSAHVAKPVDKQILVDAITRLIEI